MTAILDCSKCLTVAFLLTLLPQRHAAYPHDHNREVTLRTLKYEGSPDGEERLYLDRCEQSSEIGHCTLAIDGEVIQEWTQCASRSVESKAWWKAFLETPSYVSRVVIHSAPLPDAAMLNALNDFLLAAGDKLCYKHVSKVSFVTRSFPCDSFTDFIIIESNRKDAVMPLCEFEVYGKPVQFNGMENSESYELRFMICAQAEGASDARCYSAYDRNFAQHQGVNGKICVETGWSDYDDLAWWQLVPYKRSLVEKVKIYNRLDACCKHSLNDFSIWTTEFGTPCASHKSSEPFATKIFMCNSFGKSVLVKSRQPKTAIMMCQIQVFGYEIKQHKTYSYEFKGCYKDNPDQPDFELMVGFFRMDSKKCYNMCKRLNKLYFAIQNGRVCMCGNKYGRYGKASDKACEMFCHQESGGCGGRNHSSVFEIII